MFSMLVICITTTNKISIWEVFEGENLSKILAIVFCGLVLKIFIIMQINLYYKKRKFVNVSKRLHNINKLYEESFDKIIQLYHDIDITLVQENISKLKEVILKYSLNISKSESAFMWLNNKKYGEFGFNFYGDLNEYEIKFLNDFLKKKIENDKNSYIIELSIKNKIFIILEIKTSLNKYGFIGIGMYSSSECLNLHIKQLSIISQLLAIALGKLEFQKINDKFIISEEQNRIANELHDNVSQRIFSIMCCVHILIKKISNEDNVNVNNYLKKISLIEQLEVIKTASNSVLRELKECIYRMSCKNERTNSYFKILKDYFIEVAKLNDVEIIFNSSGNEELLVHSMKKGIYRIISEFVGNSIRHGRCNKISIKLDIKREEIELFILDDGCGFDMQKVLNKEKNIGIGIHNIISIVDIFNGKIDISSCESDKGTKINVKIPIFIKSSIIEEGGLSI